ncbi:MAG: outer membrane beta-barrel protein [Pseudomonadota bacterium]
MQQESFGRIVLLFVLISCSAGAAALEIGADLNLGMTYTDNSKLTSTNEDSDWIVNTTAGVTVFEDTGAFTTGISASLEHLEYLNGTFANRNYYSLNGVASWEQFKDRLVWQVEDYFAQVPVDTLDAFTPDNIQDTNVFSFGPEITLPVGQRSELLLQPQLQDYYYGKDDIDNRQYGLTAGWHFNLRPTLVVGVDGETRQVNYDNETLNPNYSIHTLHGMLERTLSRLQYNVTAGATRVDRDMFKDRKGMTGSLDVKYNITRTSSLRTYLVSSLTDANIDLLRSMVDPQTGDFTNEQATSDILRNNTLRVTYQQKHVTTSSQLWAELRDLDYTESTQDLRVQAVGMSLDYPIAAQLKTGIIAQYIRTRQLDTGRTDKEYIVGGNASYGLSRKLRCNFGLQYQRKDSTQTIDTYKEFKIFAGLVYDLYGQRQSLQ